MIERELKMEWDRMFYPGPEPEEMPAEPMDVQVAEAGDGSAAFGVFPQMKPNRAGASEIGANLPLLAADMLAAGGRGGISGIGGLIGDIESLGRGLFEIGRRGGDEGAIDAFLRGMSSGTIMPTSDDVNAWLDKNIGPVVPQKPTTLSDLVTGGAAKTELQGARETAAGAGRLAGEIVADPFAAVKGAKAAAKTVEKVASKRRAATMTKPSQEPK